MVRNRICVVEYEDLERWREVIARKATLEAENVRPTTEDVFEAHMAHYRLAGEMSEKYGIDDIESWNISVFTGVAYYMD
jgi:hypothetical protein